MRASRGSSLLPAMSTLLPAMSTPSASAAPKITQSQRAGPGQTPMSSPAATPRAAAPRLGSAAGGPNPLTGGPNPAGGSNPTGATIAAAGTVVLQPLQAMVDKAVQSALPALVSSLEGRMATAARKEPHPPESSAELRTQGALHGPPLSIPCPSSMHGHSPLPPPHVGAMPHPSVLEGLQVPLLTAPPDAEPGGSVGTSLPVHGGALVPAIGSPISQLEALSQRPISHVLQLPARRGDAVVIGA